jgi:hypothetical protein
MNIVVQNRRNLEFDLADLDVYVKEFIDDNSVIVTYFISTEIPINVVLPDRGEDAGPDLDPQKEVFRFRQNAHKGMFSA